MKTLINSLRTLCLMVIACMVSLNALAYTVYSGEGDIVVSGKLLVNQDATVNNCTNKWGTLIIAEGVTLTVTGRFEIMFSEIYVFGTLNIQKDEGELLYESTVYVMEGGSFSRSELPFPFTQYDNVSYSSLGCFLNKVNAQFPSLDNNYCGWKDYYQRILPLDDGTELIPTGSYYEDAAGKKRIADLDAWKAAYSLPYKTCYETGVAIGYETGYEEGYTAGYATGAADAYTAPTGPGMRLKVITKDGKVYEFQTSELESAEYYRANE